MEWLRFLVELEKEHTKQDHALAAIAAEVRRSYSKKPKEVKDKDFLIQIINVEQRKKMEDSKRIWASHLRLKLN